MASPNSALEAAIHHFAQQPGVTPADVNQLRAAMASDADLTTNLGKSASSGALNGFALSPAESADRPVGDYDRAVGIVTLPTSSVRASSTEVRAVLSVQSMIVDFGGKSFADTSGAKHPVTADMLTNLQDTMNGSPVLADELKRAATTAAPPQPKQGPHRILESFEFTSPTSGTGGSYSVSNHAMNLPSDALTSAPPHSPGIGYRPNDLTFVIGHEIQHGFNAQAAEQARALYTQDVRAIAKTPGPVHDYTALVERHIQSGREDEAKAEIAGWNALRSRVERQNGSVTLTDMRQAAQQRVDDFVESTNNKLVPRANVSLNADLTMSQTPANVAAMGHNYFDRPVSPTNGDNRQAMHLGHGGVSDYANYYAGWAVATISVEEQNAAHRHGVKPQVQINMAHAGLRESMMEQGGLNLEPSRQSVPYLDSSTQPAVPHTFDHTTDGPNQFQYVPVAPARLDEPDHADHALFKQVRGHVAALDQSLGRTPDQHTDQISSALAVQARFDGLHRIDQIALSTDGNRLWAVQMPPGRTDHLFDLRTSVPTTEAMTPMHESAAKWPDAMQQFQQTQQQQNALSQQVTQDQAHTQGPVMSHGGLPR